MSTKLASFKKFLITVKELGLSMLNKVWEVNFIFSNILIPLIVLTLYFVSFKYLLSSVLHIQEGVNYVFVSRSWKYFSILTVGVSFIFFLLLYVKRGGNISLKTSNQKVSRGDFLLLLLPLTPVVQYILNNQDILSLSGSMYVVLFFVVFSSLYVFAIPALLGFVGSTRILINLGLAFVFTIISMVSLSQSYAWYEAGSLRVQWTFLGGVFLIAWLFYNLNNKWVLRFLVAGVFVTNSALQVIGLYDWTETPSPPVSENKLLSIVGNRVPVEKPNIYLLIYDAYVPNETMLAHGIDNRSQEEYLKEQSFEFYPHTYSVANYSIASMSFVLNASTDFYGKTRRAVSGDGVIQNALRGFGYKTYGLFPSDFFFLENDSSYGVSVPGRISSPDILWRAILLGEFRFEVGFSTIPREQFVEAKRNIFQGISRGPVFVYMHSNLPGHSQNSGACLPDETEQFQTRLSRANLEMQQDLDTIIDNDPGAIIIVAGDHGPNLTKNCQSLEKDYDASEISRLDIQDRFGTFLAIRWPSEDFVKYDDITVLQDIFPAVFAYLYKDDSFIEAKIESTTFSSIVFVQDGIIYGGIDDGEPLFVTEK